MLDASVLTLALNEPKKKKTYNFTCLKASILLSVGVSGTADIPPVEQTQDGIEMI